MDKEVLFLYWGNVALGFCAYYVGCEILQSVDSKLSNMVAAVAFSLTTVGVVEMICETYTTNSNKKRMRNNQH
jgi:hypothetical protein